LKIRLWVRRLKGEIWSASQRTVISGRRWAIFAGKTILSTHVNTNTSFLRNTSLWKLLLVLKRPNSRACALETTASFFALPVSCVPGPREDARGREALETRMKRHWLVLHQSRNQSLQSSVEACWGSGKHQRKSGSDLLFSSANYYSNCVSI
jgi:hypothetical protein